MNGFDIAALALVGLAARRGYRKGLAVEFYRLLRLAVAIIAGTSLYGILSDALSALLKINAGYSEPILFVAISLVVWNLLRRMRRWIESLLLTKTPQRAQAVGGAIAAAIKTGIFIIAIVTTVSLSTWMPGHSWIAKESVTGAFIQSFLPEA